MPAKAHQKPSAKSLAVLGVVALCVYAIDQVSKFLVVTNLTLGERVTVLGPWLQFNFVKNSGAAFSIGTGLTWVFSIVAIAVLIFIIWYARRIRSVWWALLFGLLLGGLLGNLTDRLARPPGFGVGEVVDFIQIPLLPAIFNMADSAIVASMALFLILSLSGVGMDGKRHRSEPVDASNSDAGGDGADT